MGQATPYSLVRSDCPFQPSQAIPEASIHVRQLFTLLDLCVSSLRRGRANIFCIVPISTDDPRRESKYLKQVCIVTTSTHHRNDACDSECRRRWQQRYQGSIFTLGDIALYDGGVWLGTSRGMSEGVLQAFLFIIVVFVVYFLCLFKIVILLILVCIGLN